MNDSQVSTASTTTSVSPAAYEATEQEKRLAIGLISGCHTLNHLQYSITSVLFPVMMTELGFGLLGLGVISAVSSFVGQGLQVVYGFFSGFFKRTTILGFGNVMVGLVAMLQFFVRSFPQLLTARVAIDIGSSPQHPLGSSVLSRYYPKARGWALTFHHTAGNLGSFIGPALASLALLYMGWQTAFVVFGLPSVLMGLTLFLIGERTGVSDELEGGKKKRMKANLNAYLQCLKNRNIIFTSLVLMVGAAGRGTGVNNTYLVPFFMERFGVSASAGGFLLTLMLGAGLIGPLTIAWFSDRIGKRTLITQGTLLVSAIMTFWLAQHASLDVLFYLNLILYGAFVQARGSLTQTMIGDFATPELTDAAFSIYYFVGFISGPIWTLIIGYVMESYGFTPAFYVAGGTYLAGMLLLLLVKEGTAKSGT
ncbi:MAG TPA: MFS transporter [Candidatus Udaeobacter sp.]|jgi:MFS family permease|nr:MFS transporter [Candidatus Udaeobacter sp.]